MLRGEPTWDHLCVEHRHVQLTGSVQYALDCREGFPGHLTHCSRVVLTDCGEDVRVRSERQILHIYAQHSWVLSLCSGVPCTGPACGVARCIDNVVVNLGHQCVPRS